VEQEPGFRSLAPASIVDSGDHYFEEKKPFFSH
jgi:hypothetical protein